MKICMGLILLPNQLPIASFLFLLTSLFPAKLPSTDRMLRTTPNREYLHFIMKVYRLIGKTHKCYDCRIIRELLLLLLKVICNKTNSTRSVSLIYGLVCDSFLFLFMRYLTQFLVLLLVEFSV